MLHMPRDSCREAQLVQGSIIHLFCFKLPLALQQLSQSVRALVLHQLSAAEELRASGRVRIALAVLLGQSKKSTQSSKSLSYEPECWTCLSSCAKENRNGSSH